MNKVFIKIEVFFLRLRHLWFRHFWMQAKNGAWGKISHGVKIFIKHNFFDCPYLAVIETGNTCNLSCPTCTTPRHLLGRPPQIMKLAEFQEIIDKIKDFVYVVFLYNTNEPLLNPEIAEMADYCQNNHLYSVISTNATLLDAKKSDEILSSGLDEILLCFDGTTKESYEPFRTGAKFETVLQNIKYFCAEKKRRGLIKPFIELQFILTKLNQDEVAAVKQLAKELKVDRLKIKSFALCEYAYSPQEIKELSEKFLPTAKEYDYKIIFKQEGGKLVLRHPKPRCAMAKSQLAVLVDGRVVMCCYDIKGEYVYGNLFKQDFRDAWFNPEVKIRRNRAFKKEFPLCKICGEY